MMININNTPWDELTLADIQTLLCNADGESFFFEFKSDDARNQTLHKEISAFANTYGGYILLGISDDKSISGCSAWSEQRIHNVIYNGITPTPDFDVKKFIYDNKTIFVIKIEEGSMPPYITTDGKIFSRVSSASMPINDSIKLVNLYEKRKDRQLRLKEKIEFQELQILKSTPSNLCAYLDLGFEIQCMDMHKLTSDYINFDFLKISDLINQYTSTFSISSLGYSHQIVLGELRNNNTKIVVLPDASMNSYMEVMMDGSAKCRICLFADNNGSAEVSSIYSYLKIFENAYSKIFKNNIDGNFIYANKYEKLTVIRQFTPYFNPDIYKGPEYSLEERTRKFGNSIIVSGNRIPYNGYRLIDKRYLDSINVTQDSDSIISELFQSAYICLGYILPPLEE